MKNRTICTTAEVDIDVAEILYELDYGDIYDWIGDLEPKDRAEFLLGLPECFEGIPIADLLGDELLLSEALEVVTQAFHKSPYDRDKIKDALKLANVI